MIRRRTTSSISLYLYGRLSHVKDSSLLVLIFGQLGLDLLANNRDQTHGDLVKLTIIDQRPSYETNSAAVISKVVLEFEALETSHVITYCVVAVAWIRGVRESRTHGSTVQRMWAHLIEGRPSSPTLQR